jgi:hypothetical protein
MDLGKKDGGIDGLFSTNAFYFALAAGTKEVEADAVSLGFDDFVETRSQLSILSLG